MSTEQTPASGSLWVIVNSRVLCFLKLPSTGLNGGLITPQFGSLFLVPILFGTGFANATLIMSLYAAPDKN